MNTSAGFVGPRRTLELVMRAIRLTCPRCGHGPLFRRGFSMTEQCPICALRFEREHGYFVGAIYLNSAATVLIFLGTWVMLYLADTSLTVQLVVSVMLAVLVPLLFYRHSKSFWLAMDYFFDPEVTHQGDSWAGHVEGLLLHPATGERARPRDTEVRVECYSGSRGQETPRRVWLGDRWQEATVLDRWLSEPAEGGRRRRAFRVRLDSGTDGLIYYDEGLDAWFWRAENHKAGP